MICKTTRPKIEVILLNWNGWPDTIACLHSLKSLEYDNYCITVVDNGSTDESVDRIRAACPGVPIIQTGRNLGFSGGCNAGIRAALRRRADYIWLLNNDTVVESRALNTMVGLAEADPRIGAVGSVLYYLDSRSSVQAWGGGRVNFWSGRSWHFHNPVCNQQLHYLTGASMLLRRRALEEVGLLDENTFFMYWEDADLSFRLRKAGWRLAVSDNSVVFHKENASTGKGSPLLDYYFNESAVRFFSRHALISLWPISVGVLGRVTKRLLRMNLPGCAATLKGTYAGFRRRLRQ